MRTGRGGWPAVALTVILWTGCGRQPVRVQPSAPSALPEAAPTAVVQSGVASWYGEPFHGRRTANGEVYDMYKLTAAHRTLPFNTIVEVVNLENDTRTIVRINDRGPFVPGRIIDLSYKAARYLGMIERGTIPVELRLIRAETVSGKDGAYLSGGEFYLQVGAFRSRKNAAAMQERLQSILGDLRFVIHSRDGYHRVISEPLSSRREAERFKRLLEGFRIDAFIRDVL